MQQTFSEFLRHTIFKNRITLSFAGAALFLYFASPSRSTVIAGIPFIIIGEIMRTWASGFIKKNEALSQSGPYALTRNPLYAGNFLIGMGFSIMTNRIVLLLIFLVAFYYIYSVTIQNEEKFLSAKFGETFLRYKERVPVFFPFKVLSFRSPSHENRDAHFEWKLAIQHREHHTWIGIIAGLIIFLVKVTL